MPLTEEEISQFRVVDLKAKLATFGLPTHGLKNELVDRLYQHLQIVDVPKMPEDVKDKLGSHHGGVEQSPSGEKKDGGVSGSDHQKLAHSQQDEQMQQEDMVMEEDEEQNQNQGQNELIRKAREQEEMISRQREMEEERLIQHKVREQQRLLEQQQQQKKQEDLYRLQHAAFMEKQREEQEKEVQLLRLQREALKQKEEENIKLPAPGVPPGVSAASARAPVPPSVGARPASVGTVPVLGPPGVKASVVVPPSPSFGPRPQGPINVGGPTGFTGPSPVPSTGLLGPGPGSSPKPTPSPQQPSLRPPLLQSSSPRTATPMTPQRPPVAMSNSSARPPGAGLLGAAPPAMTPPGESPEKGEKPPPLMSLQVSAPKEEAPREVKLPQALEQALAFKSERAKQVGVNPEDVEKVEREGLARMDELENQKPQIRTTVSMTKSQTPFIPPVYEEEDEEVPEEPSQKNKQEKKKKKKRRRKGRHQLQEEMERKRIEKLKRDKSEIDDPNIEIEYIQDSIELDITDPNYRHFTKIFEAFRIAEPEPKAEEEKILPKVEIPLVDINKKIGPKVPGIPLDDDDDDDDDDDLKKEEDDKPKLSKRKMKLLKRMSIAELKQTVSRPDVVEMHDVTAKDPKLLVHLKATRNTVPVPRHWCFKRKYLQGKRGIEKPPFELPDFIKRTGIMEMRAALQEKEDQKTLKAKMRDKVRPKMGKIDIDYQKLHDAFFKWQTKPKMTIHGDLYYEGKEFETKMKDKKPGEMSDDLRIALGMPVGANAHKVPPPWLIAMQRYGPPPSYPNLKIPGLNAPIPEGCSFGYHAGGWGKPPVDNMGKPIYGDVFGTQGKDFDTPLTEEEVERTLWGELESESEEESEEESDEESDEDVSGLVTPGETGLVTPSGISSLPAGLETPDMIELRKKRMETEMEGGDTPALYTILPEKRTETMGRAMMGSTHTYDIGAAAASGIASRSATQGVEVALDPSELDLVDTDAMAARYEATLREQQKGEEEDFSDMVAEHAAKQRNKRRKQQQDQNKPTKKYKDFKF
ncbi:splicing factor 3B subunit 2 [Procambarus clarkii]|uniref:splicing factor 3B subunit 2 n=1 Tax=Procambarus clarkii TaxID=6728 RepID=UPI001E6773F7|nr:splicing factor 3B subunit 2-like [Procambarus clarkii]